jgi:hypothetical protein
MMRARALPAVAVAIIAALGLWLRLAPVIQSPERQAGGLGPFADARLYDRLAVNLAQGNGFSAIDATTTVGVREDGSLLRPPAVTRPPAYPAFLAMQYAVIGDRHGTAPALKAKRWHTVRLVQGVLDVATGGLAMASVATLMPAAPAVAIGAFGLYALNPYTPHYTRAILTETLAIFLVALALLLTVRAAQQPRALRFLLAGAGWGLAALCQAQLLLLAPLVALGVLALAAPTGQVARRRAVLTVAGAAVVVAPWTLRNAWHFREFIPVAAGATGPMLLMGTWETAETWEGWGVFPERIFPDAADRARLRALDDSIVYHLERGSPRATAFNAAFTQRALEEMRRAPGRTVAAWVDGVRRLWFFDYILHIRDREAPPWYLLGLLIASVGGFITLPSSRRRAALFAALPACYLTVIFLPLHVEARFIVSAIPGLCVLAALGVAGVITAVAQRRLRGSSPSPAATSA